MTVKSSLLSIADAAALSPGNKQTLLAYLHFLHMLENLHLHNPQSNYRNYQYHWVRSARPVGHWV